jgi:hypothetical protein
MMYALEWYDIPRNNVWHLVEYHPYLTNKDKDTLYYVNNQHFFENCLSTTILGLVSNRLLIDRFAIKKGIFRWPLAGLLTAVSAYAFNLVVLRGIYYSDLEKNDLSKYYTLDLNAEMMKKDLEKLGIEIEAKHFNLQEIQKNVEEKEAAKSTVIKKEKESGSSKANTKGD